MSDPFQIIVGVPPPPGAQIEIPVQTLALSGFSGYSGSGSSGFSGYSGLGYSGPSGFSGYSAASPGPSGYSGYSGLGVSGYSGYSGPTGSAGGAGASGFSGYSGTGLSGFSGYSGSGVSGYSGSGISGYSGYSGSGFSGYSGAGLSGFSGFSGYSGKSGYSGYSGYSGSGISGYSGYSGSGLSGYSGYSGSGLSGYSGYSGSGLSGYSGYSGSGLSGYSGYSSVSGYSGYSSVSGYSGYSGGGGGTPGGTNTQVQYNNSSVFGGITNATSDGTTMTLTSPKIITSIKDTNANTLLGITTTASAVNYLTLADAAAAANPSFTATGTDTNVGMNFLPKGTGQFIVDGGTGANVYPMMLKANGSSDFGIFLNNTNNSTSWTNSLYFQAAGTSKWGFGNDFNHNKSDEFGIWNATSSRMDFDIDNTNAGIGIPTNFKICWGSGANPMTPVSNADTGLARNAAGVVEVNNGTPGTLATLKDSITDASTGYRVNGAAANAYVLTGNGTNFVSKMQYASNGSSAQATGFAADTYVAGSTITINAGDVTAGSRYHCVFDMTKTGAGTATPIITIRIGTAGTTADTAVQTITFGAGTAVADTGTFDVYFNFRAVGGSATIASVGKCSHNLAATGLTSTGAAGDAVITNSTSSVFSSSTATKIGISFNGGASFSGTINIVQAEFCQP
jgi:hypothetical protein